MKRNTPKNKKWCGAFLAACTLWCSMDTSHADPNYKFYEQGRLLPTDPIYVIDDDDTHVDFYFGGSVAVDGNAAILGDCDPGAGQVPVNAVTFYRWDGAVWGAPQTVVGNGGFSAGDLYGVAVAISGDYAVVGAQGDDATAADAGAAYIYKYNSTTEEWEQKQKINGGAAGDLFGCSVTVSGNTVIVGARGRDTTKTNAGWVYVYTTADSGNTWTLQDSFGNPDAQVNGDTFGWSCKLQTDQLIVGAAGKNAAYIFTRSGSTWSKTTVRKLTGTGIGSGDYFGWRVDIDGDRAVVTAPFEQRVFIYNKPGGGWATATETAKLAPVLSQVAGVGGYSVNGEFGGTAAIDGNIVVVGDGVYGMVTVYKEVSAGVWKAVQMQRSSDFGPNCRFGYVDIEDGRILVGAPGTLSAYSYLVIPSDTQSLIASDAAASDNFGVSMAVDKEVAVVGASGANAAYVYTRDPLTLTWTQSQIITGSDTAAGDKFGCAVAVSGNTIAVGANFEQDSGSTIYGSVYVFTYNGTSWVQQQKIRASDAQTNDRFGTDVEVDVDTLVVGAWAEDTRGTNAGAVYVYTRSSGTWSEQQIIRPSGTLAANDAFGAAVDIYGDTLVAGGVGHDVSGAGDAGGVLIYTRSAGVWSQQGGWIVASDAAASDNFGKSVSLDGDRLAIGSYFDDDGGSASGSVYVFERSAGTWSQQAKIIASDDTAGDNFGTSVSLFGDEVLIGSPGSNAIYRYTLASGTWGSEEILLGSATGESYGFSVALGYGNIAGGGYLNDDSATDAGRATIISYRTRIPASNMALWLDAQDIGGGASLPNEARLVANGNGTSDDQYFLTKWIDKSFNGNHLFQATTANQPELLSNLSTSTLPTIKFDGSNDVLAGTGTLISGSTKRTITAVVKSTTTPGATAIFADGGGSNNGGRFIVTPEVKTDVTGGSRTYSSSTGTADYRLLTVVQTGTDVSSVEAYLDGVKLSQSAVSAMAINTDTGTVSIGAKSDASSAFAGEIAEILVYSRAFHDTERKWVETYLSDKWLRPGFKRVALHMPEFRSSQANLVLNNWQLRAADLNSVASDIDYTVTSVPANGTLKNNGTTLTTSSPNNIFTQADVNSNLITFTHTGSSTDSHASFSFTIAGDTGSNGKVYTVNLVRLEETPAKKMFGHTGDISLPTGYPSGQWFQTADYEAMARNLNYLNADMTSTIFSTMDNASGSVMTRLLYNNSSSTNSRWDAVHAETYFRNQFGIMMTPAGLIDETSGITSSQTTFKIKQRENPAAPGTYFPIGVFDPTSYSLTHDISPLDYQVRDAVMVLRVGDELMKVTDWNSTTRVATVVRGFESGISGALCSVGVAHSNDAPVFSPLYIICPNTASTGDKTKLRYVMDWSQPAGREYHGFAAMNDIDTILAQIPGYEAALWWDIFGTVNGAGFNCNAVPASKWNTNTNLTEAWDTRFNSTHQEKYQQLKIGDVKTYINNEAGYVPFMSGNSYKTEGQRQFMISQAANNYTPIDGMFIEHFDVDSRYNLVLAMASQEAGVPVDGSGNNQMAIMCKHLKPGYLEDAIRDRSERLGYAYFLLGIHKNSNCHYGIDPKLYDSQNNKYGAWNPQFFYPVGEPKANYDVMINLDDPGHPTPDSDDITYQYINKRYTFPSQYWPGTQVEWRDYDDAVVMANFGGYNTTIQLPSYTGPSGTTNQYLNTRTGQIVTSWTTTGIDDSNIFLRLKN